MEWQETGLVLLTACAVLLLPGLAVCAAAGARSILLLGLAGPVSVSIIGLGAVLLGLMDRPLTPAAVVVATVVAAVPILVLRLATAGPSTVFAAARPTGATAGKVLAAAVAFGVLGSRLLEVFQRPDSISQTLDNIFHLNLAKFILDTGSGSSLAAGQLTDPGAEFKPYPAAWHDVVALVAEGSGASVPVAASSVNLVIGAVLWPLAVMLLGTVLGGDRPVVWLLSGLLAGAFAAFPYLMVDFGVLYPNYLSLALLPALLALLVSGTQKGAAGIGRSWLLFLLALPGLGLAHPSSLVALAALSLPMGVRAVSAVAGSRRFSRRSAAAGTAAVVGSAYGAVVYTVWAFLRPEIEGIRWEARMNPAQAFGEGILNAPLSNPVPVLVAVLTALGVGSALRSRRNGWVIGVLGIGVGLYTVAIGFPWSDLRTALVGSWYNDPARLAALLPASALGAVLLGATAVVDRAAALTRAAARAVRRGSGPRRLPAAETSEREPAERRAALSKGAAATPGRGTPDGGNHRSGKAGPGDSSRHRFRPRSFPPNRRACSCDPCSPPVPGGPGASCGGTPDDGCGVHGHGTGGNIDGGTTPNSRTRHATPAADGGGGPGGDGVSGTAGNRPSGRAQSSSACRGRLVAPGLRTAPGDGAAAHRHRGRGGAPGPSLPGGPRQYAVSRRGPAEPALPAQPAAPARIGCGGDGQPSLRRCPGLGGG
ncbi:hypothetical protein BN1051_02342 [Arthrobacter saudimassiliensis]|uniref:Uncharacterized protein n=1 Tax=Arthrobacter saudimassiliensis TaxID=1461584 RepID=A0A078MRR4_9MICC|nr:hypothetical protein BN1051_02342 [Arthrobacter saudimassiliensis]